MDGIDQNIGDLSGRWTDMRVLRSCSHYLQTDSSDNIIEKTHKIAINIFKWIRNHEAEIEQTILTSRFALKTINNFPEYQACLNAPIGSLGVFLSIFGIANSPFRIFEAGNEIIENNKIFDLEGLGLSCIHLVEAVGDGLDSYILFNYSLSDLIEAFHVPEPLQQIFLPLSIALTTLSMGTRTVKIVREKNLLEAIENYEKSDESEEEFVKKLFLSSEKEIDVVSERKLKRCTSDKIIDCLKSLRDGDKQKVCDIKRFTERKIKVGYASLVAGAVTIVALSLFAASVPLFIPLMILTALAVVKLGIYIYENRMIYEGLPTFSSHAEKDKDLEELELRELGCKESNSLSNFKVVLEDEKLYRYLDSIRAENNRLNFKSTCGVT